MNSWCVRAFVFATGSGQMTLCLCGSGLTFIVVALGRIRLQPLAQEAKHSRYQVEGDDHQDDDEKTPWHRQIVAGEW